MHALADLLNSLQHIRRNGYTPTQANLSQWERQVLEAIATCEAHDDEPDYCPCCLHFPCCCQDVIDQGARGY